MSDRSHVFSEADADTVLVAGTKLADDTVLLGCVCKADAEDGEPFGRADADVFDLEVGGHVGIVPLG